MTRVTAKAKRGPGNIRPDRICRYRMPAHIEQSRDDRIIVRRQRLDCARACVRCRPIKGFMMPSERPAGADERLIGLPQKRA